MTPSAVEPWLVPITVGTSWQRDPEHPSGWHLPKLTLGWAIVAWQEGRLQHASGRPWRYTPEQLRLLLWWYALDDDLRFVYDDGVLQRLKGWGKDPFAATLCATEFVGPCRPDLTGRTVLDPWGNEHPAGVEHPEAWIQVAAVSKDQTRNTMTLFPGLFTKEAIGEYAIDLGKEIIYAHRGARRIEAVTSSPRALEGGRPTFTILNETHHWLSNNEGHEMADVIERNATKSSDGMARRLAITNAPEPGEDSVAERDRDAYDLMEAQEPGSSGMLYDSLEAHPDAPLTAEAAPAVVESVRGDSWWLDVARIVKSILDKRNPPSRSRRFWYNQRVASEDAWIAPAEWQRLAEPVHIVPDGAIITLGFDGSESDDHTALVGCEVDTGFVWPIDIWLPGGPDGRIDKASVDFTVRQAFEQWDVVGFYGDEQGWSSYLDSWAEAFGQGLCITSRPRHPIAWDMRSGKAATAMIERLHDSIVEGAFTHDGSSLMAQHFYNARRAPNAWGISVRKEHRESARKIDAVPATGLARQARSDYLALPASRRRRQRTGRASFL